MVAQVPQAQILESVTIFDVLADRARSHSTRFLGAQAGVTLVLAGGLRIISASWWPLATVLLAVSAYSAWGILDARPDAMMARSFKIAKHALVLLATVGSLAGVVGTALAAFTGDAPGPYGTCYGRNGRAFSCDAHGRPR